MKAGTGGTAIAILGRAPVAGQVKTRLAAGLGDRRALAIYRQLLETCCQHSAATGLPCYLFATEVDHPEIQALALRYSLQLRPQCGGDLGERMADVFASLLEMHQQVLLVGTDCPFLVDGQYFQALGLLSGAPVALLAARDGGYVLIGAANSSDFWRRPAPFAGVRFGTGDALQDTIGWLAARGVKTMVAGDYIDVDEVSDLSAWMPQSDLFG